MPARGHSAIAVDTSQIPEHIRLELLSIAYDATAAYFQQPGVEERYQRWKAEKAKKAAEGRPANEGDGGEDAGGSPRRRT